MKYLGMLIVVAAALALAACAPKTEEPTGPPPSVTAEPSLPPSGMAAPGEQSVPSSETSTAPSNEPGAAPTGEAGTTPPTGELGSAPSGEPGAATSNEGTAPPAGG